MEQDATDEPACPSSTVALLRRVDEDARLTRTTKCFLSTTPALVSPALTTMALRLFNTLTRSVQEYVPLDPAGKSVGMYCCGPTVYDFAHIGNWRTTESFG